MTKTKIILLAVGVALALAACGSSNGESSLDTVAATTDSAVTTDADATATTTTTTTTVQPETTTTTSTTSTTTTTTTAIDVSDPARSAAGNLLLIDALERNEPEGIELKGIVAKQFTDDLYWERVNTVSGSVTDEFGMVLLVDATSGYRTTEIQQEKAIEAVDFFAKGLWDTEGFGPVLADGNTNGAINFWLTADGAEYKLSGAQMIDIHNFTISAQEAMGL